MFLARAWNGNIAVWQSVLLVSIVGYILTFTIGSFIGFGLLHLQTTGVININLIAINNSIMSILILAFATFATRSLWKSARNSKSKISHALTKLWAVIFGFYLLAVVVSLVS